MHNGRREQFNNLVHTWPKPSIIVAPIHFSAKSNRSLDLFNIWNIQCKRIHDEFGQLGIPNNNNELNSNHSKCYQWKIGMNFCFTDNFCFKIFYFDNSALDN